MTWSLNEVTALARKAGRGAGQSWGLAEETGRVVNWLAARGVIAPTLLGRLLLRQDGLELTALAPRIESDDWVNDGWLCPIIAGATLSDRAATIGQQIVFHNLAQPLLIAPATASVALVRGAVLGLDWDGGGFVTDGRDLWLRGQKDHVDVARLTFDAVPQGAPLACTARVPVDAETTAILNTFAGRTYAPATEESRRAGAGGADAD